MSLTLLLLSSAAVAAPAKLHVTASNKAGTLNPTWRVSRTVRADISEENIDQGSRASDRMRDWVQNDVGCPTNDDAGHFIAWVLGGTGTRYKNIFPENRQLNRGRQSKWEVKVRDYVISECDEARVVLTVYFDDNENPDTRPVSVRYKVRCVGNVVTGGRKSLPTKSWTNTKPPNCP